MQFLADHIVLILGVLLGISEALSLIPVVKSNGIFQAILGLLQFIKEKVVAPKV